MGDALEEISGRECRWATLAHVTLAFAPVVATLILLRTVARSSPYVRRQVVEALDFQITVVGCLVLAALCWATALGPLLAAITIVIAAPYVLLACIASSNGQEVRYPLSVRVVR